MVSITIYLKLVFLIIVVYKMFKLIESKMYFILHTSMNVVLHKLFK